MTHSGELPKFVYVGRLPCGCVSAVVSDYGDKSTGEAVAEFIASGRTIERVSFEDYRTRIISEPGFMDCIHKISQPVLLASEQ